MQQTGTGGCACAEAERMALVATAIKKSRTRDDGADRVVPGCCWSGGYLCRLILKLGIRGKRGRSIESRRKDEKESERREEEVWQEKKTVESEDRRIEKS